MCYDVNRFCHVTVSKHQAPLADGAPRAGPSAPDPGRAVIRSAFYAGTLGLVAGMVGPALLSNSNLGPLSGMLVTGPVSALLGALWGLVSFTRTHGVRFSWLVSIWMATVGYSAFASLLSPTLGFVAFVVQLVFLLAVPLLLHGWSDQQKHAQAGNYATLVLFLLMVLAAAVTLLPPVAPTAPAENPKRALFLLDPRLDASRHVPPYRIRTMILLRYLATITVAGVGSSIVAARGNRLMKRGDCITQDSAPPP
jgi:hypothetical protein